MQPAKNQKIAMERRPEVPPGEDRALGEPIQWAAFSHRQLYDAVHMDNEPNKAHERGREWGELAKEVDSAAQELAKVLRESESGWQGPAADAGRSVMRDLSRRGDEVSRTSQGVGRYLTEQAGAMERAKAEMPAPPDMPAEEFFQRMVSNGGTKEMIGFATTLASVYQVQENAQHQQAVDVMTRMETASREVDEATPGFKASREGTAEIRERLALKPTKQAMRVGKDEGEAVRAKGGSDASPGQEAPTSPKTPGGPEALKTPDGEPANPGMPEQNGAVGGSSQTPGDDSVSPLSAPDGSKIPGAVPPGGGPNASTPLSAPDGEQVSASSQSDMPDGGDSPTPPPMPDMPEIPTEPAETASDSASATPLTSSGGPPAGAPVTSPQSFNEQQHWNQLYGPNSGNQKWSGSLDDKDKPKRTKTSALSGDMPETPSPLGGGPGSGGGGTVPPLSSAGTTGGGSTGGGAAPPPGGTSGVGGGAGGGGAVQGGSTSGSGSTAGGTAMGGAPMGAGGAGARQGGGGEEKEHRSPEYLKDQSLFDLEDRPAPPVIGEKFKKKQ